jgi:hypothetical protein
MFIGGGVGAGGVATGGAGSGIGTFTAGAGTGAGAGIVGAATGGVGTGAGIVGAATGDGGTGIGAGGFTTGAGTGVGCKIGFGGVTSRGSFVTGVAVGIGTGSGAGTPAGALTGVGVGTVTGRGGCTCRVGPGGIGAGGGAIGRGAICIGGGGIAAGGDCTSGGGGIEADGDGTGPGIAGADFLPKTREISPGFFSFDSRGGSSVAIGSVRLVTTGSGGRGGGTGAGNLLGAGGAATGAREVAVGGGGGATLPAAGSTRVKVSPVAASFTSVSTEPSGIGVALTTRTLRSGWPGNFSVMVSFGRGPSLAPGPINPGRPGWASTPEPTTSAAPTSIVQTHRFQIHRVMARPPYTARPAWSSVTAETSVSVVDIGRPGSTG